MFCVEIDSGFLDAEFFQKGNHRTPVGESTLEQVQADKSGEPEPVRIVVMGEGQAEQGKEASGHAKVTIDGHGDSPLRGESQKL